MKRVILTVFACLFATQSYAAGSQTQTYCIWDYLSNCSQYSIGTKEVNLCMANVGAKLSKGCIRALVADGYVTKAQVIDRARQQGYIVADTKNGLDIVGKVSKTTQVSIPEPKKEEPKTQPVDIQIPVLEKKEDKPIVTPVAVEPAPVVVKELPKVAEAAPSPQEKVVVIKEQTVVTKPISKKSTKTKQVVVFKKKKVRCKADNMNYQYTGQAFYVCH